MPFSRVVADHILASRTAALAAALHPLMLKQMKSYKVNLPRRKAIALDSYLQATGVTLGAMVEAAIDYVADDTRAERGEYPYVEKLTRRAREIDARRRSRSG